GLRQSLPCEFLLFERRPRWAAQWIGVEGHSRTYWVFFRRTVARRRSAKEPLGIRLPNLWVCFGLCARPTFLFAPGLLEHAGTHPRQAVDVLKADSRSRVPLE